MRAFLAPILAGGLALASVSAAPTVEQQANYDAAVQSIVDGVNAYRAGLGTPLPPLTPLKELGQGAREHAEFQGLGMGIDATPFDRATAAGYTGSFFPTDSSFGIFGHFSPQNLLSYALANSIFTSRAGSADAASIGVGIVLVGGESETVFRLFMIIGKLNGGMLGGTTGIETGTGRGIPDLSDMSQILAGAYQGDSVNGFVYDPDFVVVTTTAVEKFNRALRKLLRKPPVIKGAVGKAVTYKLPADVFKLVEKIKVKGRLPPGVKFDKKPGGFRGQPKEAGNFTAILHAELKAAINGSKKLKPIRIQFKIGG